MSDGKQADNCEVKKQIQLKDWIQCRPAIAALMGALNFTYVFVYISRLAPEALEEGLVARSVGAPCLSCARRVNSQRLERKAFWASTISNSPAAFVKAAYAYTCRTFARVSTELSLTAASVSHTS